MEKLQMEYLQAIMQMEVMVFMVVVAAMVEVELLIRPGVAHTSVHRSLAETVKEVQFVLCGAPTQQLLMDKDVGFLDVINTLWPIAVGFTA
ncbi:MAG: hypothetical protein EBR82_73120, partial [Caulobacteraceae bacterium]|nr:hypothetical protein [Caulobacteraceae bacterium]